MFWNGWPLARAITLFTGLAFILIGIQVVFFHYRQNFRQWAMWLPVVASPILGVLSIILAIFNVSGLVSILGVLFGITALAGLLGFYFHFAGVGERVDGYKLQNFLVGPPIIMPLMLSAIAVLGLLALYWGKVKW